MRSDLKFALRQLLKAPAFTITTLLTLALGIGACTAIFSVVNGVLLRPLAFPESERLVEFWETKLPQFPQFSVAPGQYFTWTEQAKSFEKITAQRYDAFTLTGQGPAQRLISERVTASFFSTLRIKPALGREFHEGENSPGHEKEVILTHGFWIRQFGGRADVVDQTIQLSGEAYTVVGVMPADFKSDWTADILTPIVFSPHDRQQRDGHFLNVIGRLRTGVTLEQAQTELRLLAAQLAQQYPDTNKGWSVNLTSLLDGLVSHVRPLLFTLLGAVGFLLVIGCVNVANLLLARAASRGKEIAIRVAQGATRLRIVRQLLTESLFLAALGGALGTLLAHWGVQLLMALAPGGLPRNDEIRVDGGALALAGGLILVTGLGFGLAPALQASRINLNETLKDGGRGTSAGGRRQRLLGALVITEIAMALSLLVGAGLLIRSFARLQNVKPGFESAHAVALELNLPTRKYSKPAQLNAFAEEAIARLSALPGVQSVGIVQTMPFSGSDDTYEFQLEGRMPTAHSDWPSAKYYSVTPDYFKAMGIPLLRGRYFSAHDTAGSSEVAIINESLAKKYFPDGDALGKKIMITAGGETWQEIIGIVGDTQLFRLDQNGESQTYKPFAQRPESYMTFVIRSAGTAPLSLSSVRVAIDAVDPEQPLTHFKPLDDLVAGSMIQQRFSMQLFAAFSGAALVLAIIGIYGVMTYAVTRRTGEIGIRMALGAQRGDVLKMIFLQGSRLVALGLAVGLIVALILTQFLSSLLYSVSAYDPLTFVATVILLAIVATLACLIPAYRATQVNPLTALQTE